MPLRESDFPAPLAVKFSSPHPEEKQAAATGERVACDRIEARLQERCADAALDGPPS